MRIALILSILAAVAHAQSPSGRHFLRDSRLPTTAPAAAAVEASASQRVVMPLAKMRSGRAWPRFHFSRLPTPAGDSSAVTRVEEAAATRPVVRRGFWGVRR